MLRVRLFGGLMLAWDHDPLPTIPGTLARSLFAYLVTHRDDPGLTDKVRDLGGFPVVCKPRMGFASCGVMLAADNIELRQALKTITRLSRQVMGRFYDSAEKLATTQAIAVTKIQSLENRGVCQLEQGKIEEAQESWEIAAGVDSPLCSAERSSSAAMTIAEPAAATSPVASFGSRSGASA